jgi:diguanylate cyclase (GGDEF)-like protein
MSAETILIVEDESIVALDIQETLLELGYHVPEPISRGENALLEIGRINPDLVLMDIRLEGQMSGLQVASEIRKNYQLPVVYLTAYSDPSTVDEVKNSHPYGYLVKPFNKQQLAVVVEVALQIHQIEEELIRSRSRLEKTQRIARLGYWEWDIEHKTIKLSPHLAEMFDLGSQEKLLSAQEIRDLIHPHDLEIVQAMVSSYLEDFLNQEQSRFRVITSEGNTRVFQSSPIAIDRMNANSQPAVLVGAVYDVTDQMAREDERIQRERTLDVINQITQAALRGDNLEEILEELAEKIAAYFQIQNCFLVMKEDQHKRVYTAANRNDQQAPFIQEFLRNDEEFFNILSRGVPEVISKDVSWLKRLSTGQLNKAYLGLPLVSGGKQLGICLLEYDHKTKITEEIIEQGAELSSHVALTIAKTRLLEDYRKQMQATEVIQDAGLAMINTRSLDEAVKLLLEYLEQLIPFDSASVLLVQGDMLYVAGSRGLPKKVEVQEKYFPLSNPLFQQAIQENDIFILDEVQGVEGFQGWGGTDQIHSWMAIPLIVKNKVSGIITADSNQPGRYHRGQFNKLRVFANQAATAIQNIKLAESERDQIYITRTLQKVSSLLATGRGFNELSSTILQLLERVVPFDQAHIALINNDGLLQMAASRTEVAEDRYNQFMKKHTGKILNRFRGQEDQPIVYPDVKEAGDWIESEQGNPVRSSINAPLVMRGEIFGLLFVDSYTPNTYTEEAGQTVMAFANQAALAIMNVRLFERNKRLALTDELTGVYNRRYLMQIGEKEVKRALRFDESLSVIILDFDNFKNINDTYGHAVGDEAIRKVIHTCRGVIRDIDILARYGGDEFVILLAKADQEIARQVAERLQGEVNQKEIETIRGKILVTISMGAAELSDQVQTLSQLLMAADEALYLAKRDGRSCFRMAA